MGTYADEWNKKYGGQRSSAPTVIIVDGIYEEEVEFAEGMEVDDEYLPVDMMLAVDRIQSQRSTWKQHVMDTQWQHALNAEMDVDPSDSTITAVLDTNVLISYLHLIQKLVQTQIQQHRRDVTLLIPGIVIQELDGLRARKESVSNAARRANDWLLPLVNRVPCLRGQKTTDSPRGNWMHNREGFQNDDLVLECANHYIASCALTPDRVKLITGDKNLQLKAEIEGISTVAPAPVWDVPQLLAHLRPGFNSFASSSATRGNSAYHQAAGNGTGLPSSSSSSDPPLDPSDDLQTPRQDAARSQGRSRRPKQRQQQSPVTSPPVAKIILDAEHVIKPPHPLNLLQDQVREYLDREVPALVVRTIEQERQQRALQAEQDKKISIHARPKRPPPRILPSEEVRGQWTAEQGLMWLDKFVPVSTKPPNAASTRKLVDLIKPFGEQGARKGENWGRGDWESAANVVERFFGETVGADLRNAVEQAFLSGSVR